MCKSENCCFVNEETRAFIREHREDDIRKLALQGGKDGVDRVYALDQIAGWQTARRKLPSWAAVEGLVYPPRLSMEQCSSEQTARYKVGVARRLLGLPDEAEEGGGRLGGAFADLTGGLGVDFSYLSRLFGRSVYVERQPALCDVARQNFGLLGLLGTEVVNGDSADVLRGLSDMDLIYLDPARRDVHGQRTFAISDCTPDVTLLKDELVGRARWVLVKLSPMLDWHKAVAELAPVVHEVHIVATGNECKELLLVLSGSARKQLSVCCSNDDSLFCFSPGVSASLPLLSGLPRGILFEPNAAIMKAGCFDVVAERFRLQSIAQNSHLFVADAPRDDFPGRQFRIESVSSFGKKELRRVLAGIEKANVSVRNFPLSAQELRRKLKIADGGDTYLFGTTTSDGAHVLMVCKRIFFEKKVANPS